MKIKLFAFFSAIVILFWSCSKNGNLKNSPDTENMVLQQDDGTISLKLDKAACYTDVTNPSGNTAEWKVVISKPGRFKIWLSSATKDTTDLHYKNSVRISFLDNQFEVRPACDKIIHNTGEFPASYFRADSYMGSFFVSEPGEYSIQVISEKVIAKNARISSTRIQDDTMLMSVILTPLAR
jgi:hypothetical protein